MEKLPAKWDTPVGQGGIGLSVGQRQRLTLTRALLEQTPWVILDEPTAHLDALTESQVIDTMIRLRDMGRTVVVIAHRKAVVDTADSIVQIESRPATEQEIREYPQLAEKTVEQFFLTEQPRLLEETR